MSCAFRLIVFLAATTLVSAAPVHVVVAPNAGSLHFNRTYPVSPQPSTVGEGIATCGAAMTLTFDCVTNPTTLSVEHFQLASQAHLAGFAQWGVVIGRVDHAVAQPALAFAEGEGNSLSGAIDLNGAFSIVSPSASATGLGDSSYSSLPGTVICFAFLETGLPCEGESPLSDWTWSVSEFSGTVTRVDRTVQIVGAVEFRGRVLSLAQMHGEIILTFSFEASAPLSIPSMSDFVAAMIDSSVDLEALCDADMNADGTTDGRDVTAYVSALIEG